MIIVMYDGSELYCDTIEIGADGFIADGYRLIPFIEVLRIKAAF